MTEYDMWISTESALMPKEDVVTYFDAFDAFGEPGTAQSCATASRP